MRGAVLWCPRTAKSKQVTTKDSFFFTLRLDELHCLKLNREYFFFFWRNQLRYYVDCVMLMPRQWIKKKIKKCFDSILWNRSSLPKKLLVVLNLWAKAQFSVTKTKEDEIAKLKIVRLVLKNTVIEVYSFGLLTSKGSRLLHFKYLSNIS